MMAAASGGVPVGGLSDLSNESRMIATPWSRMVRGLGLGQYPIDHDPKIAARLRTTFDRLIGKVSTANGYTVFASRLTDLLLEIQDPAGSPSRTGIKTAFAGIVEALRGEANPYYRVMAATVLLDAVAKLGLDGAPLSEETNELATNVLAMVDEIEADRIRDENAGRHGQYEKLSAYTGIFLSFGQLGLTDRLVGGARDRISEALGLIETVPAPFFRGRGASMLLSVLVLVGFEAHVFDGERDFMADVFAHLDRADAVNLPPAFPQPMSDAFGRFYPLVTMLNAVATSGRADYLTRGRDRLEEIRLLWEKLRPVERTHMGLYYIVALHNLGRLDDEIRDLDRFVESIVGQWREIEPGSDFFLNGIAYPYIAETAMLTGRMDLIGGAFADRLVGCFPDLDRTALDRANRPYPVSYALNALGEIGESERLFRPDARYGGEEPLAWVVSRLSPNGTQEGSRLFMLDNALISLALRMRGPERARTALFRDFTFPLNP